MKNYYKDTDYERYDHIRDKKLEIVNRQAIRTKSILASIILIIILVVSFSQYFISKYINSEYSNFRFVTFSWISATINCIIVTFIFKWLYSKKKTLEGRKLRLLRKEFQYLLCYYFVFIVVLVYIIYGFSKYFNENILTERTLFSRIKEVDLILDSTLKISLKNVSISPTSKKIETNNLDTINIITKEINLHSNSSFTINYEESLKDILNQIISNESVDNQKKEKEFSIVKIDTLSYTEMSKFDNYLTNITENKKAFAAIVFHSNSMEIDFNKITDLFICIIPIVFFNTLTLWYFALFVLMPIRFKGKINKATKYIHIYHTYFIKSIILSDANFGVGNVLFIGLSCLPGFLIEWSNRNLLFTHLFSGVAFYSFYFTSIVWSILPVMKAYLSLDTTYHNYATHLINNSILSSLKNHIIVVGIGNLGSLVINSCFFDIHREKYGFRSICDSNFENNKKPVKDQSDYDILIDKNLDLYLISKRIIVIDNKDSHFVTVFDKDKKYQVGIFPPGSKNQDDEKVMILGICGDVLDSYVLNAAKVNTADLILNTTRNPKISFELAKRKIPAKKILSVSDSPSFDILTINSYDKPVYLIDTQLIEGISLSQRILLWITKNNKDNATKKILIIGNGKIMYYVIQALHLSLPEYYTSDLKIPDKNPNKKSRKFIENNITILTSDKNIKCEIEKTTNKWNFFPMKHKDHKQFSITTHFKNTNNFETVFETFGKKTGLIVVLGEEEFECSTMTNRIINVIQTKLKNLDQLPHILTYSHRKDKFYLEDQIKKYSYMNSDAKLKSGFPIQLPKESKLTRDYVTANQYASMVRAFLEVNIKKSKKLNINTYNTSELTLAIEDNPGSLAMSLANFCNMKYNFSKESFFAPLFIFCYSFTERRYQDTYIFTGTAKLKKLKIKEDKKSNDNSVLINCGAQDREKFYKMLEGKIALTEINIKEEGVGLFKDYPISTVLRHKHWRYDLNNNKSRKRIFQFKNNYNFEIIDQGSDNYAHFKIWANGNYPGCFAEALINVALGNISERYFKKGENIPKENNYYPEIVFSSSIPYPFDKIDKDNSQEKDKKAKVIKLAQENLYVKFWDENEFIKNYSEKPDYNGRSVVDRDDLFEKGIIKAIKIKKDRLLSEENDKWVNYANELNNNLNNNYSKPGYKLFSIKKLYTEGIEVLGINKDINTEIQEIAFYEDMDIENKKNFQVIRKIESEDKVVKQNNIDRYNVIPEYRTDIIIDLNNFEKRICVDYELVIIRNDILNINGTEEGFDKDKLKNMLYFIDSL